MLVAITQNASVTISFHLRKVAEAAAAKTATTTTAYYICLSKYLIDTSDVFFSCLVLSWLLRFAWFVSLVFTVCVFCVSHSFSTLIHVFDLIQTQAPQHQVQYQHKYWNGCAESLLFVPLLTAVCLSLLSLNAWLLTHVWVCVSQQIFFSASCSVTITNFNYTQHENRRLCIISSLRLENWWNFN